MSDDPNPPMTIRPIHIPVGPLQYGRDVASNDIKAELAQKYPCPVDGTACAMMIAPAGTRDYSACKRECDQDLADRWKAGAR